MAPMTNADESPTNRLTLFPTYLSLFVVSTLWLKTGICTIEMICTQSPSFKILPLEQLGGLGRHPKKMHNSVARSLKNNHDTWFFSCFYIFFLNHVLLDNNLSRAFSNSWSWSYLLDVNGSFEYIFNTLIHF